LFKLKFSRFTPGSGTFEADTWWILDPFDKYEDEAKLKEDVISLALSMILDLNVSS
jgi:hypothetical protein